MKDRNYRVRSAVRDMGNGRAIRYIAEYEVVWLWGLVRFWHPTMEARWHAKQIDALNDIKLDRFFRGYKREETKL